MQNRSHLIIVSFVLLFVSVRTVQAQRNPAGLRLQKNSKGFYLDHKVIAKQSLFSLGRSYNVHPRHLADYNGIDPNKGLQLDQSIRIPLTATNYDRVKGQGVPIALLASTDDVIADMARFAGIDVKSMQCWNQYSGSDVKKGTSWIVGFLITSEMAGQQVDLSCSTTPVVPTPTPTPTPTTTDSSGSFFESAFQAQVKITPVSQELNLIASTFKTQSGWANRKYYVLIDNLVAGTIVRLTNHNSKKVVYAKVLGEMALIKQNEGLDMRISDAASALLELNTGTKFSVQVAY